MKFDNNVPIYIQAMNMLKRQIVSGELESNDKLPSVRELAVLLKVNPNTIQRTYQELEREGFAITRRGLGRYVIDDIEHTETLKAEMCREIVESFMKEMKGLGFTEKEIVQKIKKNSEDILVKKHIGS